MDNWSPMMGQVRESVQRQVHCVCVCWGCSTVVPPLHPYVRVPHTSTHPWDLLLPRRLRSHPPPQSFPCWLFVPRSPLDPYYGGPTRRHAQIAVRIWDRYRVALLYGACCVFLSHAIDGIGSYKFDRRRVFLGCGSVGDF